MLLSRGRTLKTWDQCYSSLHSKVTFKSSQTSQSSSLLSFWNPLQCKTTWWSNSEVFRAGQTGTEILRQVWEIWGSFSMLKSGCKIPTWHTPGSVSQFKCMKFLFYSRRVLVQQCSLQHLNIFLRCNWCNYKLPQFILFSHVWEENSVCS